MEDVRVSEAAGWSEPVDDVLGEGWVARTLALPPDAEGAGVATLVHRDEAGGRARAVLYVHGSWRTCATTTPSSTRRWR
jgi:hypothetical protein